MIVALAMLRDPGDLRAVLRVKLLDKLHHSSDVCIPSADGRGFYASEADLLRLKLRTRSPGARRA